MHELEYRSLEKETLTNIYNAFIDAFSNYEVNFEMTMEKLEEMMQTRGYSSVHSIGCYACDQLAGFTLVGVRNKNECYDIATGIIREFQNKGLGKELVLKLIEQLKEHKMHSFTLEVLENNKAAQKVYSQNGFRISRRFCCYKKEIIRNGNTNDLDVDNILLTGIDENLFCSFPPSWQNTLEAFKNCKSRYNTRILYGENGEIIGYGIIHKESGKILQLGSKPGNKRKEIVSKILDQLYNSTKSKEIIFLNIEEGSWISEVLPESGFSNYINQFEMKYHLSD